MRDEPDGVVVRLITQDEHDEVARLTVAAYGGDYQLSAEYLASLADVPARARDHDVWVAVRDGAVLGTVGTPRPGQSLELARDGELDFRMLAVAPAARRSGIGRTLVEHVLRLAADRGCRRVVLHTGLEMVPAHRLYEQMGFRRLPDRTRELPDGRPLLAFGLDLPAPEHRPHRTTLEGTLR